MAFRREGFLFVPSEAILHFPVGSHVSMYACGRGAGWGCLFSLSLTFDNFPDANLDIEITSFPGRIESGVHGLGVSRNVLVYVYRETESYSLPIKCWLALDWS